MRVVRYFHRSYEPHDQSTTYTNGCTVGLEAEHRIGRFLGTYVNVTWRGYDDAGREWCIPPHVTVVVNWNVKDKGYSKCYSWSGLRQDFRCWLNERREMNEGIARDVRKYGLRRYIKMLYRERCDQLEWVEWNKREDAFIKAGGCTDCGRLNCNDIHSATN